jgi:hypothetical protein
MFLSIKGDWSSDVCSSDLTGLPEQRAVLESLGVEFEYREYLNEWTFIVKNKNIAQGIGKLGLKRKICYYKFIPEEYFYGSVSQRLALLQGLVDNDGTVSQDGMTVEYNTSSKQLSDDVIRLVRSLGGVITFSTRNPTYTYKGEIKVGNVDHRIRIKLPNNMCPVKIPTKVKRFVANSKYPPAISIANIVDNGTAECTCIAVDAEDHLYVTKDYIVTHNTVQSLVALNSNDPVIVICPASVKYNWRDEIRMWRPEFKVTICNGRGSFVIPEPGQITICNYDILPEWLSPTEDTGEVTKSGKSIKRCTATEEQKRKLSLVTLISDEIHLCKNYRAIRSQKVKELSGMCMRVWFMTGTPLMTRPSDLYGVLESGHMNVFGSWDNFVRLFNGFKNQWGGYEFGMPLPEVPERMKRVMLRRLKSEVLKDLPPKTYKTIAVDNMSCDLRKRLDQIIIDQALAEGHIEETEVEKARYNIELLVSKLDISSLPSFEEFSKIRALLAESRIPAMLEIIEIYEDSNTPLVVFSAHKKPILELGQREGWAIITGETKAEDRTNTVRDFQDGKLKGVALTIQAGGVGITLTRASNVLFVDQDWTPALNLQAEDRLCRIGAKSDNILIQKMVSNHPLDIHIQQLIDYKTELTRKALEESIKFKPLQKRPKTQDIKIIQETEEEMLARINEAEKTADVQYARNKIHSIAGREIAKADDIPEPTLTHERKELIRDALDYMLDRCDGAVMRDGKGFNRPDAAIAHWIGMTGLEEDDAETFRVTERILSRYYRQLHVAGFGAIWKPDVKG